MYSLKEMSADSRRSLAEYRSRKFFASWKGQTLVIFMLPFYVAARSKKPISLLAAAALPTLTVIYA